MLARHSAHCAHTARFVSPLPGREAFCLRDVAHQAIGAHALGMQRHVRNMLHRASPPDPEAQVANARRARREYPELSFSVVGAIETGLVGSAWIRCRRGVKGRSSPASPTRT